MTLRALRIPGERTEDYKVTDKGYLQHKQKLVLIKIDNALFALRKFELRRPESIEQILENYEIRFLKEE